MTVLDAGMMSETSSPVEGATAPSFNSQFLRIVKMKHSGKGQFY